MNTTFEYKGRKVEILFDKHSGGFHATIDGTGFDWQAFTAANAIKFAKLEIDPEESK